jgi:hypothetical protein
MAPLNSTSAWDEFVLQAGRERLLNDDSPDPRITLARRAWDRALQVAAVENGDDYWIRQHTAARLAEMAMRRKLDAAVAANRALVGALGSLRELLLGISEISWVENIDEVLAANSNALEQP